MSSLTYATQDVTHRVGLTQSPMWMNGHGDFLSRRVLIEPSSIDLVEAFKMDTDSTALVSYMLQALTSDAVVTLQSPHDSTIARHLIAVEKVLSSYATYLGKKPCATHMEPQGPLGTFVTNTPPPSRSSRDSTKDEYRHITGEGQPDYRTELGSLNDFADPVKSPGPALQDTAYHQSSAIQASLAPTDAYECHRPPSKEPVHPGPVPVAYGPSKGAKSSSDRGGIHPEGVPRSSRSTRPSWLCAPSPSFLPTPSFLLHDAQRSSSLVDRDSPPPLQTLFDDDESTWRRLEHAISDARNQVEGDEQEIENDGEAIHPPDPSSLFSSDSSLDDSSCFELSVGAAVIPNMKQPAPIHNQSFRPFSVSPVPEQRLSVAEAYQSVPQVFFDVSETGIPGISYNPHAPYSCSGFSGWCPSSSLSQMDLSNLYSGKTGLGPYTHLSLTSPNDSLCSSDSMSSTASFMDEHHGHVHAPKPIRLDARPGFMDLAPPRILPDNVYPLSGDTFNVYSQMTQMLLIPTHEDILLFVEKVFGHVMSGGDALTVVELLSTVFRFWDAEHVLSHGLTTSNSWAGWIEFTSQSLAMRIRQEFKKVANANDSFATKVELILKFILHLQVLPSVADKALRSFGTLVDGVLKRPGDTQASACVMAQRISILLAYFSPFTKGLVHSSWEGIWQTVRSVALSLIYGKLRGFVRLFIENMSREMYARDSVMFLATFLASLTPRKVVRKVVPIKKLVTLLNTADGTPRSSRPQRAKTAATLLLLVSSDGTKPGCVACSRSAHQQCTARTCVCTAYSELLKYDSQMARSLVTHGLLNKAFECLEEIEVIETCVNNFPRERWGKQVLIGDWGKG